MQSIVTILMRDLSHTHPMWPLSSQVTVGSQRLCGSVALVSAPQKYSASLRGLLRRSRALWHGSCGCCGSLLMRQEAQGWPYLHTCLSSAQRCTSYGGRVPFQQVSREHYSQPWWAAGNKP